MEIANCRLKLNRLGSDVPLTGVTPAEVLVLKKGHEITAGGDPILDLVIVGHVALGDGDEVNRLKGKYPTLRIKQGDKDVIVVDTLFSGHGSRVPQTFKEIGMSPPKQKWVGPVNYDPMPAEEKVVGGQGLVPEGEDS